MLVLKRKLLESIRLTVSPCATPQSIEIVVTDICRGSCKLGFKAGPGVAIARGEIGSLRTILDERKERANV